MADAGPWGKRACRFCTFFSSSSPCMSGTFWPEICSDPCWIARFAALQCLSWWLVQHTERHKVLDPLLSLRSYRWSSAIFNIAGLGLIICRQSQDFFLYNVPKFLTYLHIKLAVLAEEVTTGISYMNNVHWTYLGNAVIVIQHQEQWAFWCTLSHSSAGWLWNKRKLHKSINFGNENLISKEVSHSAGKSQGTRHICGLAHSRLATDDHYRL